MLPREDIAAALFTLTAPLSNRLSPAGPFTTLSRRIVPAAQAQQLCPALFQMQDDERVLQDQRQLRGQYASNFSFFWIIYAVSTPDTSVAPSSALNPLVDAALSVLPPANVPFTVDGIGCVLAWDQGRVNYIEGIIADVSIAEIPITVSVPWASNVADPDDGVQR